MDYINNLAGAQKAVAPPAPQLPTNEAAFAGHGVSISNLPAPPVYSLDDPEAPPGPPPAYTPVDTGITERLSALSTAELPASLQECLLILGEAYNDVNFQFLATSLSFCRDHQYHLSPFWTILNEIIRQRLPPHDNNKNLQLLADRLWTFVSEAYDTLVSGNAYKKLSEMTIVTCMYFLEELCKSQSQVPITGDNKEKPEGMASASTENASTENESVLASRVIRMFRSQLCSGIKKSKRWDAMEKLYKFEELNKSVLTDDPKQKQPATVNLKLSGLRYEDIPGTTISKQYASSLKKFSQAYKIDLAQLVEIIGKTRPAYSLAKDILVYSMNKVYRETHKDTRSIYAPKNFFADQSELFRDRNARCLLTLMEHCQRQVFNAGRQPATPEAPEIGEKCHEAPRPVLESSASSQQDIQTVVDKLRNLLLAAKGIKAHDHDKDPEVLNRISDFFNATAANNGWR
ncbi:hypothetical protein [Endozoicomonas sp. ONNA2]|uniref:hypothetical protein n=1 Tax=Endozoicomonas sp. ONNA2 TaxID=2828741 RepID=UPI0021494C28|nr:hypothetical protein [Endozoicomonas sp. ONNA2]